MPGAATEPSAAAAANAGRLRGMAKAAASPLAALRGAVAAEPQRWSWQLDGQTPRPIGPALLRWLEHVDAAFAGGRPDAAFAPAPQGATPAVAQGNLTGVWNKRLVVNTAAAAEPLPRALPR